MISSRFSRTLMPGIQIFSANSMAEFVKIWVA